MTIDLSNFNRLALKDLPDDLAAAMFTAARHGTKVEVFHHDRWVNVMLLCWNSKSIYRIAPSGASALTPDKIKWKHLPAWVLWTARNVDARTHGFSNKPNKLQAVWRTSGIDYSIHLSDWPKIVVRGTVPWDQSLQARPVAVQS